MSKKDIYALIKKDPKLKCDRQVSAKLDTYTYEMLRDFSKLTNVPVSEIIRNVIYDFLISYKDFDRI